MAKKKYSFEAKIESAEGGGAYILFPYDVEKEFGSRGKIPVKASFDGVPYRGSLIKYGAPQHMLPILKAIREETGKQPGDRILVELWKDEEPRVLEIPPHLAIEMKRAGVAEFFDSLSYTHRKEYVRWISEAKKEDTRARRIEQAIEMLRSKVRTPGSIKSRG